MIPIRQQLTVRLTLHLVLAVLLGGSLIWYGGRQFILSQFDATLMARAELIQSTVEENDGHLEIEFNRSRLHEFKSGLAPVHFQIRSCSGLRLIVVRQNAELHSRLLQLGIVVAGATALSLAFLAPQRRSRTRDTQMHNCGRHAAGHDGPAMNCLTLFAALSCLLSRPLLAGDFTPLFPKDGVPEGWVIRHWADVSKPAEGKPVWTVKDGMLTGSGDRGCWFLTEKEYGDFELEYEFRLGVRGNSGLALRTPAAGDPAFDGMELQMADFRYNPQAKPSELTGGLYRAAAPSEQVYKPEDWNAIRITLKGTQLKVVLNGMTIQDTDLSTHTEEVLRHNNTKAPAIKDRPRRGRIGFQNLSRDNGAVEIKGARIRELES
jgi:hypothetical protein